MDKEIKFLTLAPIANILFDSKKNKIERLYLPKTPAYIYRRRRKKSFIALTPDATQMAPLF